MIPHVADPIVLAAAGATCALGLLAIVWVASAEKVGTIKVDQEPRPRCEAPTSVPCRNIGNRIEHAGGVHWLCTRHASWEGWTR